MPTFFTIILPTFIKTENPSKSQPKTPLMSPFLHVGNQVVGRSGMNSELLLQNKRSSPISTNNVIVMMMMEGLFRSCSGLNIRSVVCLLWFGFPPSFQAWNSTGCEAH